MARDVGKYFEQLTRKGRGGRRTGGQQPSPTRDTSPRDTSRRRPRSGGGSWRDSLRDAVTSRTQGKRSGDRRRDLPPEGVVTIEYSPHLDGDPDPGEVVWTWVPFEEDPEQGKDRPVIVIGRRGHSLVGVPLTTKQNGREAQVSLGTGDWDPKHRPSYARIWRMLDIDPDRMRREGAVLDERRFERVVRAVDEYYDIRRTTTTTSGTSRTTSDDSFDYDY